MVFGKSQPRCIFLAGSHFQNLGLWYKIGVPSKEVPRGVSPSRRHLPRYRAALEGVRGGAGSETEEDDRRPDLLRANRDHFHVWPVVRVNLRQRRLIQSHPSLRRNRPQKARRGATATYFGIRAVSGLKRCFCALHNSSQLLLHGPSNHGTVGIEPHKKPDAIPLTFLPRSTFRCITNN